MTKTKILIYAVAVIAIVLICLIFLRPLEDTPVNQSRVHLDHEYTNSPSQKNGKQTLSQPDTVEADENPKFIAIPLSGTPESEILAKIEYPKYRFAGSGTRGAIRDAEGMVIWRASEENPVYSVAISSNYERLVVGAGDGNAYVITNGGKKLSDLPQLPPGKDMLGLGNWKWLDNRRLLGESGVQKFDEKGRPVGCCQGHNVSESRFYVYDLQTGELEEMRLPEALRGKVVNISKVLKSGEMLMGHEGEEFEWYEVSNVSGEEN